MLKHFFLRNRMAQGAQEIHHIWVGSPFRPTPAERRNLAAWKTHFPGATQTVWTDADAARLLPDYPEIQSVYENLKPIPKADILRYLVMHARGGVYADLDYELLRPFEVHPTRAMLIGSRVKSAAAEQSVNNCLLTSPAPGHPFWERVIRDIPAKLANNKWKRINHEMYVIETTGPSLLHAAYRADPSGVGILPWQQFNPCDDVCPNICSRPAGWELYGRHVSAFSWGSGFKSWLRGTVCGLIRHKWTVLAVVLAVLAVVLAALAARRYQLLRKLPAKLKRLRRP